ncbi:MAG: NAD(P)-dependent oxidoreductase, partial [Clostridia bacterium]|nr:NAD(P)-dependent oxidoreductase [Clostridia bacterium]
KILLIGGEGELINKLIIKLRKERHKIFLVTGKRNKNIFYEKVFERFDFPYDGESMCQIFRSVCPDLTIFMGAVDSNFHWDDQVQQESVRYDAALTNILMSYSMVASGRFLYLSSADMYDGYYADRITEDTPIEKPDYYHTIMKKAEDFCVFYRQCRELDIAVLRLDRLWSLPRSTSEVRDICAQMCLQAMKENRITYRENHSFTWIYETDAVEYIDRMIKAKSYQHCLYQITSGNVISERELAEKIAAHIGSEDYPVITSAIEEDAPEKKTVLSNDRYSKEFGLNFFCDLNKVIEQTASRMLKNKERFLNEELVPDKNQTLRQKFGWLVKVLVPYAENLACFFVFYFLNSIAGGSSFFSRLDFFLLYVLLFAMIHGQRQATISALLGTVGFIVQQMYLRSSFEIMLDYNTYIWVVQLFTVGLLVGYQHDQYHMLRSEITEEKEYLRDKIADIEKIHSINVRVKDSLETQIINQSDSIGKIYSITSSLDRYLPEEVMFQAVDVLKKVVNSRDVAIYTVSDGSYARLYTATSPLSRMLGNSVKLTDLGDMYSMLQQGKVYINRELNENAPQMAVAVKDGDKIRAVLMIWNISWEAMTLNTANLLTVVSMLIQNAVLRAQKYLDALEETRFSSRLGALEHDAFTNLLQVYENARSRNLTDYTLLALEYDSALPDGIGLELAKRLRQNDYIGVNRNGVMCILLTNTDVENAQIVKDRLQAYGYTTKILEVHPE